MNSPIHTKQALNQNSAGPLDDLSSLSFGTGLQGAIQNALGISNKRGPVTSEGELSEGPQTVNRVVPGPHMDKDPGTMNNRGAVTRFSSSSVAA